VRARRLGDALISPRERAITAQADASLYRRYVNSTIRAMPGGHLRRTLPSADRGISRCKCGSSGAKSCPANWMRLRSPSIGFPAEARSGRCCRLQFRCPCLHHVQCRRGDGYGAHVCTMFSVDEATATAVRQVYEASGEFSAVVEFRRHFPGITSNETARLCVRTIANWKPLSPLPPRRTRTCRTRSLTP
jgi:hypothetical protein